MEAAREPKVRRISNKPSRKVAGGESTTPKEPSAAAFPIATLEADGIPKTDQKRGNRRRRGKGKPSPNESETLGAPIPVIVEETIQLAPEIPAPHQEKKEQPEPREKPLENRQQQPQKPRRKPDPGKVAKNAWKIFLAEVSEEGVALIADNDARELARRCFRLSEIFLEEEDKRG